MSGFGGLGCTTDPCALVPGLVDALYADAQDLRARAAEVESEAEGPIVRPVTAWTGEAADLARIRRGELATALGGVAQVYRAVAVTLEAHAQTIARAQAWAKVAIDLWAAGIDAAATTGASTFLLRPRNTGVFGPTPTRFEADPGAPLRRQAEAVLDAARHEVTLSQHAAANILDTFSEGLPDGRFHVDQFLAGIGDWVEGIAGLVWTMHPIRAFVDNDAFVEDGRAMGQGLWDTGAHIIANPGDAVPILFDTRTMHDNPGRWWGRLAPDIALTAAGAGAGLATRFESSAARAANLAEDLADIGRTGSALDMPGGRWADPAVRQQWVDDLADSPAAHPQNSSAEWADYQRRVAGDIEYDLTTSDGISIRADGVSVDVDTVVAVDAKFTVNPAHSPYTGTAPDFVQGPALAEFDSEIWRYGRVIADTDNPVGRLRIIANTPESLAFLAERARGILGEGVDIVGVLQP